MDKFFNVQLSGHEQQLCTGGIGGKVTFTICTTDTNDPKYACGDERDVGTCDDGHEYWNVVRPLDCPVA